MPSSIPAEILGLNLIGNPGLIVPLIGAIITPAAIIAPAVEPAGILVPGVEAPPALGMRPIEPAGPTTPITLGTARSFEFALGTVLAPIITPVIEAARLTIVITTLATIFPATATATIITPITIKAT
ncbi:MAG: hypothetical protein Q4P33_03445, partial [Flaviflexus sp.]|nr:hypothetical protein [Flaviflexus sp.]